MAGQGRGWLTAEYGMLPASTGDRKQRDVSKGRPDGRTVEIQRLIGRRLRGVMDFSELGERTIYVDCDVLQADGGTRCASITGGYVALELACRRPRRRGQAAEAPAHRQRRRRLVRDRRRHAAARPRLPRGLHRRGRRQRRHDRRGRPRRGAGDRRAHPALARPPGRAARARPARASSSCARFRPRPSAGSDRAACVLATRNAHKLREFGRLLPRHRARAAARRRRHARPRTARPTPTTR